MKCLYQDMRTNFHENQFIFDRCRAKNQFERFFETLCILVVYKVCSLLRLWPTVLSIVLVGNLSVLLYITLFRHHVVARKLQNKQLY